MVTHQGDYSDGSGSSTHRGTRETCSAPGCGPDTTLLERLVEVAEAAMRRHGRTPDAYGLKLAIEAVTPLIAVHTLRGAADDRGGGDPVTWQDNPRMKAAALWGVSTNEAYPVTDRLTAAIQALDLLFEHLEQLDADGEQSERPPAIRPGAREEHHDQDRGSGIRKPSPLYQSGGGFPTGQSGCSLTKSH